MNWNTYSAEDGISSNNIFSSITIFSDTVAALLLGTDNGTTSFNIETNQIVAPLTYFNTDNSNILSNNILSLGEDFGQNKWLGTDLGISVITDNDSVLNLQSTDGNIRLYNDYITSIAVANDTFRHVLDDNYVPPTGLIYAGTNGGGVGRFYIHEVDGVTSASVVEQKWSGLPSDTVLTVFIDSENVHWYGTTKGVAAHKEHDSKNANWIRLNSGSGLINNYVTSIIQDNSGVLWIGTAGGLTKYDGENLTSFTEANGLIDNMINDIAIDHNDMLWIATAGGISKLDPLTSVKPEAAIPHNSYSLKLDAYPNPFNPSTTIRVIVRKSTEITVNIYNVNGELVKRITEGKFVAGTYHFTWNAQNNFGEGVNSGIYIIQAVSVDHVVSRKILYLK